MQNMWVCLLYLAFLRNFQDIQRRSLEIQLIIKYWSHVAFAIGNAIALPLIVPDLEQHLGGGPMWQGCQWAKPWGVNVTKMPKIDKLILKKSKKKKQNKTVPEKILGEGLPRPPETVGEFHQSNNKNLDQHTPPPECRWTKGCNLCPGGIIRFMEEVFV